jgi:hypothetical protein
MRLKKICTSFSGVTYSLEFSEYRKFQLFLNFFREKHLEAFTINYKNKCLGSLSDLKGIYEVGSEFSLTTEQFQNFSKTYAEFHNLYNSEKSKSSYQHLGSA